MAHEASAGSSLLKEGQQQHLGYVAAILGNININLAGPFISCQRANSCRFGESSFGFHVKLQGSILTIFF